MTVDRGSWAVGRGPWGVGRGAWTGSRRWGIALCALLALLAIAGPRVAPSGPAEQHADFVYAPPMLPRVIDAGSLRLPFVYPLRLEDRLEHRYAQDRARRMPLRFFHDGHLVSVERDPSAPWFPLGSDALGRDQLARLAVGARLSLGVALVAAFGALLAGAMIGSIAGFAGGSVDDLLMRVSDVILALPAVYVVLALRAAMPLVLSAQQIFWTMVVVLAAVGWPVAARGVRAVVAAERHRDTQKLRGRSVPVVRGYCYVTCCPPHAVFLSSRRRCSCRRSSWRKRRCPSSDSDSARRFRAGARCCAMRVRDARSWTRRGCLRPRWRSCSRLWRSTSPRPSACTAHDPFPRDSAVIHTKRTGYQHCSECSRPARVSPFGTSKVNLVLSSSLPWNPVAITTLDVPGRANRACALPP